MSLINVNVNVVAYADEDRSVNPSIKFSDLKWSLLGLPTANPKMVPIDLAPNETKVIMESARTLSFTGSTVFDVVQIDAGPRAQLVGDFGARTARSDGDGTTEWTVTRSNNLVRFTYTATGAAPSFGGMVAGDGVTVGFPFSSLNRGDFTVVKVGGSFIEFVNAIGVAETVVGQLEIYSSGPVQVGDILDLTSSQFSQPNRGEFTILRVADSFIEFSNESAVTESVTGVTDGVVVYPEAFRWLLVAVDRRVVIRLNGDSDSGTEVEPLEEGNFVNNPGLMLKRGKVFRVEVTNLTLEQAKGFVFLAE